MSEENKTVELNEEQLGKVSGGFTKNSDGTFNLKKYDAFTGGALNNRFTILQDYNNITLDDRVFVEYSINHVTISADCGQGYFYLKDIFSYTGINPDNY